MWFERPYTLIQFFVHNTAYRFYFVTQQNICGNMQTVYNFNECCHTGKFLAALYQADIIFRKTNHFSQLFNRQPPSFSLLAKPLP